jgi:hypothetical protein
MNTACRRGRLRSDKQESRSFLKKRTKKLLRPGRGVATTSGTNAQKSFASFLQKRRLFPAAGGAKLSLTLALMGRRAR